MSCCAAINPLAFSARCALHMLVHSEHSIILKMTGLAFSFFLRSSIGGVAYVTVFNSSATWAATFHLRGYKCMLAIFVFP